MAVEGTFGIEVEFKVRATFTQANTVAVLCELIASLACSCQGPTNN